MAANKETLEKELNEQIGHEFASAYLYLAMSAHLNRTHMTGASHWMRMQAQEELLHAMKLFDFIADRDWDSTLPAVPKPPDSWESPLATFDAALAHERKMTERLNDLMNKALSLKDHATVSLLQWFVNEQVEEEATLRDIIPKFKLVGQDGSGLFLIDQELGQRPAPQVPPGNGPA